MNDDTKEPHSQPLRVILEMDTRLQGTVRQGGTGRTPLIALADSEASWSRNWSDPVATGGRLAAQGGADPGLPQSALSDEVALACWSKIPTVVVRMAEFTNLAASTATLAEAIDDFVSELRESSRAETDDFLAAALSLESLALSLDRWGGSSFLERQENSPYSTESRARTANWLGGLGGLQSDTVEDWLDMLGEWGAVTAGHLGGQEMTEVARKLAGALSGGLTQSVVHYLAGEGLPIIDVLAERGIGPSDYWRLDRSEREDILETTLARFGGDAREGVALSGMEESLAFYLAKDDNLAFEAEKQKAMAFVERGREILEPRLEHLPEHWYTYLHSSRHEGFDKAERVFASPSEPYGYKPYSPQTWVDEDDTYTPIKRFPPSGKDHDKSTGAEWGWLDTIASVPVTVFQCDFRGLIKQVNIQSPDDREFDRVAGGIAGVIAHELRACYLNRVSAGEVDVG